MPNLTRIAVVLTLTAPLALAIGCGDANGRQRISGQVTLDGQPLPNGSVSLRPIGTGPLAVGRIEDGKFILGSDKGPLPGAYLIEIESQQKTGNQVALVDNPSIKIDETEQVIPPNYNERSELRIDVKPDGGNHFEFELTGNQPQ